MTDSVLALIEADLDAVLGLITSLGTRRDAVSMPEGSELGRAVDELLEVATAVREYWAPTQTEATRSSLLAKRLQVVPEAWLPAGDDTTGG